MKKIIELLEEEMMSAFQNAGYGKEHGKVAVSSRPDLCQYQCNGAMGAAKQYKKAPVQIAGEVADQLKGNGTFKEISVVAPGFINLKVKDVFLAKYMNDMYRDKDLGCGSEENPKTIVLDYGGPNVAKPLHVGHLRSAIIGESVKRILRFMGNEVIGDVHLGDWGLQMGLIITELKRRRKNPPYTMGELEEIYPFASSYAKEHPDYYEEAQETVAELQKGDPDIVALWRHIVEVSVADIRKIYDKLNVAFELWNGESDARPHIAGMVDYMKAGGHAYVSEGALVVDVKEDTDKKEVPPCIIIKSDGATLYQTTDLATIIEREKKYRPDQIIYVADKRQSLHFEQVFRCARKTKLVREEAGLTFIGFGTMNGKDGRPFKTRDGGTLRLENLITETNEAVYQKIMENREAGEEEAREIAVKVGLAAIKYGDLSNQASKDYVFDLDRFVSFEGNTGPYILYTIVRIKSVLAKFKERGGDLEGEFTICEPVLESEMEIMLQLARFGEAMEQAYLENAPHKICQYLYELSNVLNKFYHENKIIAHEDEIRKNSWIQLLKLVRRVLETGIGLLGLEVPERM